MNREVFNYPPSVEVLKLLTRGSLRQNLAKAVRLWVILRSIYGKDNDVVKLNLGDEFTFGEWRDLFFIDARKHHIHDKLPDAHDIKCRCAIKLDYWLFNSDLSIGEKRWYESFQKHYPTKEENQEKDVVKQQTKKQAKNHTSNCFSRSSPDGRLFAVTGRNLKANDFQFLVNLGWLELKKVNNRDIYFNWSLD
ncbi:MAG: hypothetical protein AAF349_17775 [Cyanobacteria bacterium P01_A01_bin.68]